MSRSHRGKEIHPQKYIKHTLEKKKKDHGEGKKRREPTLDKNLSQNLKGTTPSKRLLLYKSKTTRAKIIKDSLTIARS